jgi:hypothetical protein
MAIKYKAISDKIKKGALTETELSVIEYVEKLIDQKIETSFDGNDVSIDLGLANFSYNKEINPKTYTIPGIRKELMFKELEKRYRNAGWKATIVYGEDDGPNRPGQDYWVLSGKGAK